MSKPTTEYANDVAKALGIGTTSRWTRLKRWAAWGVVAIAAAAVGVLWLARSGTETVRYKTEPVTRGDLVVTVSATGTLEPTNQVDVGIEVSGTIKTVDVDYNDRVKVGQILARLDTTKLEAQALQTEAALGSARAKVLQAQANVREAEAQLARLVRVRELSRGKVPSQQELDAAQAALDRSRADEAAASAVVSQNQATLDANRTDLSKAVIRSPINGVVLKRSVEPGQTVAASFQAPVLFTIAEDLTNMELQVDVDEADVGQVNAGQDATFTVDAYPDRTFPARITKVRYGSQTVAGVVTYKAVLTVDNSSLSLRPGMTATAAITVERVTDAILVPNASLRFTPPTPEPRESTGGGLLSRILPRPLRPAPSSRDEMRPGTRDQRVWIVSNGELEAVPVTTGATDGVMTEVTEGRVEPGMAVVVDRVTAKP
ncbi:MAG: efflux RND transporter periplasmic adaptor subunit [Nitrospirota bacterium]